MCKKLSATLFDDNGLFSAESFIFYFLMLATKIVILTKNRCDYHGFLNELIKL
jgi:hypothetical protein